MLIFAQYYIIYNLILIINLLQGDDSTLSVFDVSKHDDVTLPDAVDVSPITSLIDVSIHTYKHFAILYTHYLNSYYY